MKRVLFCGLAVFGGLFVAALPASAQSLSACSVTGGVTSYPAGACWGEPDTLSITVYEAALCTAAPTAPTAGAVIDLTNCVTIFSNAAGSRVSVSTGVTTSPSGTFTRPPDGVYTHAYVNVDKTFRVKTSVDFGAGAAIVGQSSGTGRYCATTSGSSATNNTSVCGSTPQTAATVDAPVTSFGGGAFKNADSAAFTGTGGTVNINAYLVNSAGTLAAATGTVSRLIGVQTFASPLTITSALTGMDVGLNTSAGMTILDNAGALQFDSGPFRIEFTPVY